MMPQDTSPRRDMTVAPRERARPHFARQETLIGEMVRGAVLPRLLKRKDEGAFDRGPNVVRFPATETR